MNKREEVLKDQPAVFNKNGWLDKVKMRIIDIPPLEVH